MSDDSPPATQSQRDQSDSSHPESSLPSRRLSISLDDVTRAMSGVVRPLREEMIRVGAEIDTKFRALDRRLEGIEQLVQRVTRDQDAQEQRIGTLERRDRWYVEQIKAMEDRYENAMRHIDTVASRVEELAGRG